MIFDKAQIAELASYAQIAVERVRVIDELLELIDTAPNEHEFQALLAKAPWLIAPSWTVITQNQTLKTFKNRFESYWKKLHRTKIVLAISHEDKRPDFTLVSIDGFLHIVEIKKSGHKFDDADCERLLNYADAFEDFFEDNPEIEKNFYRGWRIDLVADGENIKNSANRRAFKSLIENDRVERISWNDFLDRTRKVHEQFLDIHDVAVQSAKEGGASDAAAKTN